MSINIVTYWTELFQVGELGTCRPKIISVTYLFSCKGSQIAVPIKVSPWICADRVLYPHRVQCHERVVRTVLPVCQQTGLQDACALKRGERQRKRERDAGGDHPAHPDHHQPSQPVGESRVLSG